MELDDTLCFCFHITRRKIVNYVKRERPRYASQISECFGAGSACGWCIPSLVALHGEIVGGNPRGPDLSAEQYESLRQSYLEELKQGRDRNRLPGRDERARGEDEEDEPRTDGATEGGTEKPPA